MNEPQFLGQPQEFNENAFMGGSVPTSLNADTGNRIFKADSAPRVPIVIPTGINRTSTVHVVHKGINFVPVQADDLRLKWQDVTRRPSGKTVVYDRNGAVIARFATWEMAVGVFREAGILEAVEKKLEAIAKKRAREEKAAREKLAQLVLTNQNADNGMTELTNVLKQLIGAGQPQPAAAAEPRKRKAAADEKAA